jgi:predicted RNA-binding protein with TRAM domain
LKETSYGSRGGYGSSFGGYGIRAKPVEIGKEYDVAVTETSQRGDGVARIQGYVIFVEGARAGQKARVKITRVGERFANAQIVDTAAKQEGTSTETKVA